MGLFRSRGQDYGVIPNTSSPAGPYVDRCLRLLFDRLLELPLELSPEGPIRLAARRDSLMVSRPFSSRTSMLETVTLEPSSKTMCTLAHPRVGEVRLGLRLDQECHGFRLSGSGGGRASAWGLDVCSSAGRYCPKAAMLSAVILCPFI